MAIETSKVEQQTGDTFAKLLLSHASKWPDRAAIREKSRGIWRTLTWQELSNEVAAIAAALQARGLARGAHIVFVGDNRMRLHTVMCAAHALGAVIVPLFQDATAEEMLSPLQMTQASHVFAEDQEQVDKILQLLPRCPAVRCIVYDSDRGMRHYEQPQLIAYPALLNEGRETAGAGRDVTFNEVARGTGHDVAAVFFTSGAAGPSKGVVHTHGALIDRARSAAKMDGLDETDVALAFLPPAWIGQNLFAYAQPMVTGSCICCPESADTLFSDLREIGPTYLLAPPSVFEAMVARVGSRIDGSGPITRVLYRACMSLGKSVGGRVLSGQPVFIGSRLMYGVGGPLIYGPLRDVLGLSRVRAAYTSGDAINPEVLTFFRALGVNLKQLYGTTETGFFVTMQRDEAVEPGFVGPAAPGVELSVSPANEILVRSAGVFKEYLHDPKATEQAKTADGWFRTGDVGSIRADGQLKIVDRIKDMGTLTNGTPFGPKQIEIKLKQSPHVREAVAFGGGRDTVCVLVDIDTATVGGWANKQRISYTGRADLTTRPEVHALVGEVIAKVNAELAADRQLAGLQIARFAVLPNELDADDGVLTRMRKLRRDVIADVYRPLVDAMYLGQHRAMLQSTDRGSDGPTVVADADVVILDARTFQASQTKSAA